MHRHRNAIAALQPVQRHRQMILAHAVEQGFARPLILIPVQPRILFGQPVERGGEAHLILVILGRDGQRAIRRRFLDRIAGRRNLRRYADHIARLYALDLRDADDRARFGRRDFRRGGALNGEQAARPERPPRRVDHLRPIAQRAAEQARQRQPSDRRGVGNLEELRRISLDREPFRRLRGHRRVMAQHLQQPPDAEAVGGGTEQHRDDQPAGGLPRQVGKDGIQTRLLVRQQLFEQQVVMVGQLFQHVETRRALIILHMRGERDLLRFLARLIMIGPLQCEVDEARDRSPARMGIWRATSAAALIGASAVSRSSMLPRA